MLVNKQILILIDGLICRALSQLLPIANAKQNVVTFAVVSIPKPDDHGWGLFATEADCDVSVRLGALMQGKPFGDANDKWWTINGTPQCNNSLGSEIQSALVGVSLFWTDFSNITLSLNI